MDQSTALQNLLNGTATEEELNLLKQLLASGEISIGGNVNHSVIIIGSGNTVELTPAALDRLNARPLLGDLDRDLTGQEISFGLDRLESELPLRAPVLLIQFQEQARHLRPALKTSSTALSGPARKERVEALSVINSLCLEALDISFNALCLGEEPPVYDSRSPFRGLESFRPEDSEFFFGRKALTKRLVDKINSYPFLAVLGASGSGKSSLVMAGLIPALDSNYVVFRPGTDPLGELESARGKPLIIVDQFEELFTLTRDESTRRDFIARLLDELSRARIILTLRSDFMEEVAHYRELNEEVQTHLENVPPMEMEELRRAMEGQAGVVGLRFEADLSQQILDGVEGEPGAMPLLQHALWELWNRRHGRNLRGSEYRAFGGVKQAITSTAEKVYADCSKSEQDADALRDIFLRLTRLDKGDEGRDTRRRVPLGDLIPSGRDAASITLLLDKLANARLIVKTVNEDKTEVEVAHEALIRHWERLRIWLNEDRDALRLRENVSESAMEWERSDKHESLLNSRWVKLDEALLLAQDSRYRLTEVEQAYLKGCVALRNREQRERERRRKITLVSAFTMTITIMVILVGWSISSTKYANVNATQVSINSTQVSVANTAQAKAEEQAIISRAGELAAESAALSDRNFQLSLLLGVEAFNTSDTIQTRGTLMNNVRANPQLQMYLGGPTSAGFCVAFSSNGKMLAWGDGSGSISLWDVEANQPMGQRLSGDATTIAFSPDGKTLAAGIGRTIILWDIETGKPILPPLMGHTSTVQRVAFSPDGKTLASGSSSGDRAYTIMLWDVATGNSIASALNGDPNQYEYSSPEVTLSFSPDGLTLASASAGRADGTIDLWDVSAALHPSVESGLAIKQSLAAQGMGIESISFSPDGKHLISVGSGGPTIWDLETGQAIKKSGNEPLSIFGTGYSYAFSPDRKLLASADFEGSINLWDVEADRLIGRLSSGASSITSLDFSPDGNTLASGSRDSPVILWNVSTVIDEPIGWPLYTDGNRLANLALAPHGEMLASGDYDGSIILWDIKTVQSIRKLLNSPMELIRSMVFSPDGKYLASASDDHTARVWNAATGQEVARMTHDDAAYSVGFSPDGKYVVSGSADGTARVWEAATGQEVARITHDNAVNSAVFSPDGKYVVSGSDDHTARVWKAATGQEVARITQDDAVNSVVFSPDGKYVVSVGLNTARVWEAMTGKEFAHMAGTDYSAFDVDANTLAISGGNTVMLWELDTEKPIGQPLGQQTDEITSLAFSPDGKTLASSINDSTIILWDVKTRQPIGSPLFWGDGSVGGVTFSSDGKTLVAINDDNHIILWDVDPQSWIQKICQRVGRNFTAAEWAQYFPNEPYRATCDQWPGPEATVTP